MPGDPTDAERAVQGLSVRTVTLLVVISSKESVERERLAEVAKKHLKLRLFRRFDRALRELIERGLIDERREETVTYVITPLGRRGALLATLTLGVAGFEPDSLSAMRTDDRKAPFGRHRSDDIL